MFAAYAFCFAKACKMFNIIDPINLFLWKLRTRPRKRAYYTELFCFIDCFEIILTTYDFLNKTSTMSVSLKRYDA